MGLIFGFVCQFLPDVHSTFAPAMGSSLVTCRLVHSKERNISAVDELVSNPGPKNAGNNTMRN